jgi:hypothetical protein
MGIKKNLKFGKYQRSKLATSLLSIVVKRSILTERINVSFWVGGMPTEQLIRTLLKGSL